MWREWECTCNFGDSLCYAFSPLYQNWHADLEFACKFSFLVSDCVQVTQYYGCNNISLFKQIVQCSWYIYLWLYYFGYFYYITPHILLYEKVSRQRFSQVFGISCFFMPQYLPYHMVLDWFWLFHMFSFVNWHIEVAYQDEYSPRLYQGWYLHCLGIWRILKGIWEVKWHSGIYAQEPSL